MAIHDYNNPQHFPRRLDMEGQKYGEALQTAISHLETLQDEKQLRIKYQDIVYQICRLFDTTKDKCRIDEVVNKVKAIQELILGKKEE